MSRGGALLPGLSILILSLMSAGCPDDGTPSPGPEPTGVPQERHGDHDHEDEYFPIPEVEVPEGETGARLTLGKHAVDFGVVRGGEMPRHVFPFENTGDGDLIIYRVRPSCSCVTAASTRERIPPGESGEIHVKFDTTGRGGSDHKKVYVYCNDPTSPLTKILIDIFIKVAPHSTISILPRSLDLGILQPGEAAEADLEVKNTGDADLLVSHIESPPGGEATPPEAARIPPGERGTIRIRVHPGNRRGVEHFTFFVNSDDPFHLRMAFTASAYIPAAAGPSLSIEPEAFRLGPIGPDAGGWEFVLFNRGGEPLEIGDVRRGDGDDRFGLEIPPGCRVDPGKEARGRILFSGGGKAGSARSRWIVRSNDAALQERTFDIFATVGESPPAEAGPALLLGHTEWDAGVIGTQEAVSHAVTVFNRGDAPLEIRSLSSFEPSHPFSFTPPGPIPPGGAGEVRMHLSPGSPAGVLDYVFDVETNEPGLQGAQVFVTGYLRKSERTFPEGSRVLTILYMGDEAGEIQACGCGAATQGGLARAATAAAEIRSRVPTLLLGAGDLLGTPEPHFRLRADLALGALSLMGCDAVTIGESDLAFGLDYLRDTLSASGIEAVSSNLVVPAAGTPIGSPALRREVAGLRVAVVGLTTPDIIDPGKDGVEVRDPAESLRRALEEVRKDSDLVILLAHLGLERTLGLVRGVPGVDVAVVGHAEEGLVAPRREGKTLVVVNGGGGRTLGRLDVGVAPDGTVYGVGERIPLTPGIPDHKDVVVLLDQYRRKLMTLPPPQAVPLEKGPYTGSLACKGCHAEAYEIWAASAHGRAFTTLREGNSHYDPECIGCHTVGYEDEGGFVREDVNPAPDGAHPLIHVGCEECHGPGRAHVQAMEAGQKAPFRNPRIRGICHGCHTEDRSPDFRFEDAWKGIEH